MSNPAETLTAYGETIDRNAILKQLGEDASWRDTLGNALVITRRELLDSLRDWRIITPIIILTIFFPFLATIGTTAFVRYFEGYGADGPEIIQAFLPLIPMIVGFFPSSISLVIALESFVGEKERRSLEPLLSTPLTNLELYIGKILAASAPPLIAAYLGMAIYLVSVIAGPQGWRPDATIIIQLLLLTTVQAIVMVSGAVVVSSQTTSTRAANLLASVIILPMSFVVIFESLVIIQPPLRWILWLVALGMMLITAVLIVVGIRIFNREELLGRAVDDLSIRWIVSVIWYQFVGMTAKELAHHKASKLGYSPRRWYRRAVFPTFEKLRRPALVLVTLGFVAFVFGWAGAQQQSDVQIKDLLPTSATAQDNANRIVDHPDETSLEFVLNLELNGRRISTLTLLSSLTFGVPSLLSGLTPFVGLGYMLGAVYKANTSLLPYLAATMPHGIFVATAMIIAATAGINTGTSFIRSNGEMTVGEAWLQAIGDSLKVLIGIVIPLLALGTFIEAFITPILVAWTV